MGVISLEKSQNMYWLGRYTERVFTTLQAYIIYFDKMIDKGEIVYQQFCNALAIPDVYGSQEGFFENYVFDVADPNSVVSSLNRAFDNAVVLRNEISSESLSYIHLAMDRLDAARTSRERLLELLQVLDYLYAFWGSVDDCADSEMCRNLMKIGRYQERLDLYVRLRYSMAETERAYCKLRTRVEKSGLPYRAEQLDCIGQCLTSEGVLQENRQKLLGCLARLIFA